MFRSSKVFETVLPRAVQDALLQVAPGRQALRGNAHLAQPVWKELLRTHQRRDFTTYITKNLTRDRALALLRNSELEQIEPFRSDLDIALCSWLRTNTVSARFIGPLLRSKLPLVTAVVLRSDQFSVSQKAAVAATAYPAHRTAWLNSVEADVLTDEQLFALANADDPICPSLYSTGFGNALSAATFNERCQLLYLRPQLIDRAIATHDESWLHAAASVPLTPAQQIQLIAGCGARWRPTDDNNYNYMGGTQADCNFDPIATAAATPWRTQPLIDALAAGPLYHNAVQLDSGKLKTAYYTSYNLGLMPICDPTTASPEIAEQWLGQVYSCWAPSNQYVTLEFLKNKKLPRGTQRLRRGNLQRASTQSAAASHLPVMW